MLQNNENNKEGICCPFCNARTVYADVHTKMVFLSTHYVNIGGLDYSDAENMLGILGRPLHKPMMSYAGFYCENCGYEWSDAMIQLCQGDDNICYFKEVKEGNIEKIKVKGRKRRV